MRLIFGEKAWDDYRYWQSADPKLVKRINDLIKDCARSPFIGIGKPEPLRGPLSGWWSRRITREHRLVYSVLEEGLLIAQCRYDY
ncbi:MAG: Txe/YoeB family addiction module toxin [Beijerinckiaceae bacterium]